MTEGVQVKTYAKYIERLRKTIPQSFKVHEVARFGMLPGKMTEGRKKVFSMFASTNDMLTRKKANPGKKFHKKRKK